MTTILITLISGIIAGVLSGLLGVGGGFILVPIMVFILGISQHVAQGISLVVIIPTAIIGVWHLHKENLVDYKLAVYLALGSIVGAIVSGNLVQYISSESLKSVFGACIILMGLKMILETKGK